MLNTKYQKLFLLSSLVLVMATGCGGHREKAVLVEGQFSYVSSEDPSNRLGFLKSSYFIVSQSPDFYDETLMAAKGNWLLKNPGMMTTVLSWHNCNLEHMNSCLSIGVDQSSYVMSSASSSGGSAATMAITKDSKTGEIFFEAEYYATSTSGTQEPIYFSFSSFASH